MRVNVCLYVVDMTTVYGLQEVITLSTRHTSLLQHWNICCGWRHVLECERLCLLVRLGAATWAHQIFVLFNRKNSCIYASAHNTQNESKLKYCHPHTTIVLFCFLFLSLSLVYSGDTVSYTHTQNYDAKLSHKLYGTRVRKSKVEFGKRVKKRDCERAKQIFSQNCMSIWRFFSYTWYWYCAHTTIVFVYALCLLCCAGLYCVVMCLLFDLVVVYFVWHSCFHVCHVVVAQKYFYI